MRLESYSEIYEGKTSIVRLSRGMPERYGTIGVGIRPELRELQSVSRGSVDLALQDLREKVVPIATNILDKWERGTGDEIIEAYVANIMTGGRPINETDLLDSDVQIAQADTMRRHIFLEALFELSGDFPKVSDASLAYVTMPFVYDLLRGNQIQLGDRLQSVIANLLPNLDPADTYAILSAVLQHNSLVDINDPLRSAIVNTIYDNFEPSPEAEQPADTTGEFDLGRERVLLERPRPSSEDENLTDILLRFKRGSLQNIVRGLNSREDYEVLLNSVFHPRFAALLTGAYMRKFQVHVLKLNPEALRFLMKEIMLASRAGIKSEELKRLPYVIIDGVDDREELEALKNNMAYFGISIPFTIMDYIDGRIRLLDSRRGMNFNIGSTPDPERFLPQRDAELLMQEEGMRLCKEIINWLPDEHIQDDVRKRLASQLGPAFNTAFTRPDIDTSAIHTRHVEDTLRELIRIYGRDAKIVTLLLLYVQMFSRDNIRIGAQLGLQGMRLHETLFLMVYSSAWQYIKTKKEIEDLQGLTAEEIVQKRERLQRKLNLVHKPIDRELANALKQVTNIELVKNIIHKFAELQFIDDACAQIITLLQNHCERQE
jgi:hypothetical protein